MSTTRVNPLRCLIAITKIMILTWPVVATAQVTGPGPSGGSNPVSHGSTNVPDLRSRTGGSDWPAFLGPAGDGKSTEQGILTQWPRTGPKLVWQRQLGDGYGMPSISRGRLLMFDRVAANARLVCLNSETGRELWQFRYPTDYQDSYGYSNGPRCCPIVDDDRVYIYGVEGMLHCLRVTDGKLLWKVDTAADFGIVQNFFGVGSTPVIERDLLVVQVGGSPAASRRLGNAQLDQVESNGTAVVAFDKRTGAVRYKVGNELASYASPMLATIGQRRWCFMFARGGLLALEPSTGKLDFRYPWRSKKLESVNAANAVVVGDEVFVSEAYGPGSSLLRVRPGGYDIVWRDDVTRRDKALQMHWSTPIYHDGFLYGSSGRHTSNAELRCVEWKSGKVMWSEPALGRCSLLYVDGHFVCLGEYGMLRLLRVRSDRYDVVAETVLDDPDPGEAERKLRYPAWAGPILSHGLLYVRGRDRLVCLELIPRRKPKAQGPESRSRPDM